VGRRSFANILTTLKSDTRVWNFDHGGIYQMAYTGFYHRFLKKTKVLTGFNRQGVVRTVENIGKSQNGQKSKHCPTPSHMYVYM
jgi:hypothetical protein